MCVPERMYACHIYVGASGKKRLSDTPALEWKVVKCHSDPMYIKTETRSQSLILKGALISSLSPAFSTAKLTYLLEKTETTDEMHYTKVFIP